MNDHCPDCGGIFEEVTSNRTANNRVRYRMLLILQLMLLAAATNGCISFLDESLDANLDSMAHPHETPYDSFLRHSDEEQERRAHPEWQHPGWQ